MIFSLSITNNHFLSEFDLYICACLPFKIILNEIFQVYILFLTKHASQQIINKQNYLYDQILIEINIQKVVAIIIISMPQIDRRTTNKVWFEQVFERFPFTIFSGIQSFILYQNFTDFLGGVVQFPLALIQSPYYLLSGQKYAFPNRDSELQYLINIGRYTNLHSDVI